MKLITETQFNKIEVLNETNEAGQRVLYIEGIFAQAEKKNRNGRIYPESVLDREVEKYIKEKVATNRALGELEHPKSPTINIDRASHRIVEMRKHGADYYGKARVLDTPTGNILRGVVEGGTTIGVSTRGMGTVSKKGGTMMINEDFNLVTVDAVTDPSGIDCFVNGIMESVEWQLDENGVYRQKQRQETFEKAKRLISEKAKLKILGQFIQNIGK